MGDSIFDLQSEILMTEAVTVNSPSHEEDFDDVGCNADLYASRQDAFQGSCRGTDVLFSYVKEGLDYSSFIPVNSTR